jgi:hypothetical protein
MDSGARSAAQTPPDRAQSDLIHDPSRWLFVVVQFNETPARIVTAYANRKDPPGSTRL